MSEVQAQAPQQPEDKASDQAPQQRDFRGALQRVVEGSTLISVLSVVIALAVGAILIVATNKDVAEAAGYFFSRPLDTLSAAWDAVVGAYGALFRGAVYNPNATSLAGALKPITDTLTFATPLIVAGLGIALTFRAGLFNIGGRGQMLIAAGLAGWVGSQLDLPWGIHAVTAVAAGILGGALWGGLAGLLKARSGAHEVITTIMLNYVAFYLLSYALRTPVLGAEGQANAKSGPMAETAVLAPLLGSRYTLHVGFVLAVLATIAVAWFINRSALGFRLRAVGLNPHSARVAGINVGRIYVIAMMISGGLLGIAGTSQVLGTNTSGFTSGVDSGLGFDAITVALLGRSRPWGVFAAALLFGGFKAGGFVMQASQGISADIVVVIQGLIVLLIAAPPLVREVFRLPRPTNASVKGAL